MKFVAIRELKINTSRVLKGLVKDDFVVTKNGKPTAAIVHLDEDLLEAFILAHHPTLFAEAESARREYRRKGGIDHAAMKARVRRRRGPS